MGHFVRVAAVFVLLAAAPLARGADGSGSGDEILVPQPASVLVFVLCVLPAARRNRDRGGR